MKRLLSFILVLCLMVSLYVPAAATSNEDAEKLYTLGLFLGKGSNADGTPNFDLDASLTRAEAVTMVVRLLGKENAAKNDAWYMPFDDVEAWAKPYVSYAYAHGYTKGVNDTMFDGGSPVSATEYITFVLRAMGYKDGSDFQWNRAWEWSDAIGITHGEFGAGAKFTRGGAASISFGALPVWCPDGQMTLIERLYMTGAVTGSAAMQVGLGEKLGLKTVHPPRIGIDDDTVYTEPIRLGIMNYFDNGDDLLYYTLDGTTPTVNSTQFIWQNEVWLDKDTTIKAIAVGREMGLISAVTTAYFHLAFRLR